METLSEKPSLAEMKRVGKKTLADYQELVKGLDQFGRKPGEGWHPLADEFIGRVLELEALVKRLSGSGQTLPAREYREIAPGLARALDALSRQWPKLVEAIIAACPDEDIPLTSAPLARAAFEEYDRKAAELAVPWFQRRAVQKLLRRAEHPTAVPMLLMGGPTRGDNMKIYELVPLLQVLLMHTPLPGDGDQSIAESQKAWRIKNVIERRVTPESKSIFDRFVERICSSDEPERKAARKELEKLRHRSVDERWGRAPESNWQASKDLLAYWDGVRGVLRHPDPVYRRAALCALPGLQFSFVLDDFSEECIDFILEGLQDPDGMVRHKVCRFGADFFNMTRLNLPATADVLESKVRELLKAARRSNPKAVPKIRKLIGEIDWFRNHDRTFGFAGVNVGEEDGITTNGQ